MSDKTNIEKYNVERAIKSNDKVLSVIRDKKILKSIKELSNHVNLSYGAVWKAVKRLEENEEIIVEKIVDENGREKKVIFSDVETFNEYKTKRESINMGGLKKVKLSELIKHTNLYDFFAIVMGERFGERTQNTPIIEETIEKVKKNDLMEKLGDFSVFHIQLFFIELLKNGMKLDFDDIPKLQEINEDKEVLLSE